METTGHTQAAHPVDVVIAWVDGSDPVLAQKRNKYMGAMQVNPGKGAHPTYYASNNEVRYCVLSILKFAPFVRNIFIVTDQQDPGIDADVKKYFPDKLPSIRLVDHTEIFRGYESFLPTFGSMSIETMLWRIPGLSENFVYFNDDVMLIREVKPEDWFVGNRPVLQGSWRPAPVRKLLSHGLRRLWFRDIRGKKNYRPRFSFYLGQWNSATLLGMKFRYFFNCHVPFPFNKLSFADFFSRRPDVLLKNISFRFRDQQQYNVSTLANHIELQSGNRQIRSIKRGYIHPLYSKRSMHRKMKHCEADAAIKTVCIQSLDRFSEQDRQDIFLWLDGLLGLHAG